jgi:hypothetical protein
MKLANGIVLLVVVSALGCSGGRQSSTGDPQETVQTMLELANSGDWESYVDRFYGEKHKIANPQQMTQLVTRFRDAWGSQIIPALEEASQLAPVIEGDKAIFQKDGRDVFVLYKNESGEWTFHL